VEAPVTVTASSDRLEDDETVLIRSTAAQIARRCRERQATDGEDHRVCWDALLQAGFADLRAPAGGDEPMATATQTAAVLEELSHAVCGSQLLSHVLASELLRLSGGQLPAEVSDSSEPLSIVLDVAWRDLADESGVAWDSALSSRAIGLSGDYLALFRLGDAVARADLSRGLRRVGEPQVPKLGEVSYDDIRDRFMAFAWTMLAADLAGCAAGVLDDALAYVQERYQFGVPVGSFQAVQHLGAEAFVLVEAMRSSLCFAARALDSPADASAARNSLVAKSFAGDAAIQVTESAIQMFGGVAITWEFPAHRYLRRALADREILGNAEILNPLLVALDQAAA
jgi:alkylation response protein AidB-like acyl-CoA dehydrogenase